MFLQFSFAFVLIVIAVAPSSLFAQSAPMSGQEAYNTLRRTFSTLGYVDYSDEYGRPIRYQTSVKSLSQCILVMEEQRFYLPIWSYSERTREVTYINLAELDVSEISSTPGKGDDFPAGSEFVIVSARGPALRVQFVNMYGNTVNEEQEAKPDRVHFFLGRYAKLAQDVARSLQVLARSCGAR